MCLATGGEVLRWDLDSATGQRMTTLHNELCQLCACKAAADLEGHKAFVASPLLPALLDSPTPAGRPDPDWLKLGVSLVCQAWRLECIPSIRLAYMYLVKQQRQLRCTLALAQ